MITRSRLLVVMEMMDGGELFERISTQKNFTEGQAAKYTHQVVGRGVVGVLVKV